MLFGMGLGMMRVEGFAIRLSLSGGWLWVRGRGDFGRSTRASTSIVY